MTGVAVIVAFGEAARLAVPAGSTLVVRVASGRQVADLAIAELHQGLTRNAAGWRRFGRPSLAVSLAAGDALLDGEGERLGIVVDAPPGALDATYPGCWSEIYEDGRPGCRDLLSEALGITRAELPGVLSAFGTPARLADGGIHAWEGTLAAPGARVALRAERDLVVAVSGCPDDGIPGVAPGTLELSVEREDAP